MGTNRNANTRYAYYFHNSISQVAVDVFLLFLLQIVKDAIFFHIFAPYFV